MLFKKKKKDVTIEEGIKFINKQRKHNKENIEQFKKVGFSTRELEDWDIMYEKILEVLKSARE